MMKKMKIITMIVLLITISIAPLGCGGSDMVVVAEADVEVFEKYPKRKPDNKVISTLSAGDKSEVIKIRYTKDSKIYEIRLKDGRRGYVIFGDDFRVEGEQK